MDDTLLFIPPCCINKKLPKALTQAPHRMLTFYTHGDITMEKFYRAVSYLLIDNHSMVLSMPVCSTDTFAFLAQCFEREWITSLVLSVRRDCTNMIDKYLAEYKSRVLYVCTKDVSEVASHMVLYNDDRALYISGPMYEQPHQNAMSAYNIMFIPNYVYFSNDLDFGNPLRNILFPDMLRHRQQAHYIKANITDRNLSLFLDNKFPPYKKPVEVDENERRDYFIFDV